MKVSCLDAAVLEQITLHLGVASAVAVLIAKDDEPPMRAVPLLGGSHFVGPKDLVNDTMERAKLWCDAGSRVVGLRVASDLFPALGS